MTEFIGTASTWLGLALIVSIALLLVTAALVYAGNNIYKLAIVSPQVRFALIGYFSRKKNDVAAQLNLTSYLDKITNEDLYSKHNMVKLRYDYDVVRHFIQVMDYFSTIPVTDIMESNDSPWPDYKVHKINKYTELVMYTNKETQQRMCMVVSIATGYNCQSGDYETRDPIMELRIADQGGRPMIQSIKMVEKYLSNSLREEIDPYYTELLKDIRRRELIELSIRVKPSLTRTTIQ